MSIAALARGPRGLIGAWETEGQVRFAELSSGKPKATGMRAPPGEPGRRRYPALAVNASGEVLLAWTEGMQWGRGGALAWQLFGPDGKPAEGQRGKRDGVPAWSLVAAVALPDGRFVILY